MDLSKEPGAVFELYGPDVAQARHLRRATACWPGGWSSAACGSSSSIHRGWDQHGDLPRDIALQCKDIDQPTAALITDLKQRGLLDDTLVIWGGEFGRTVYCQGTLTDDELRPRPPPAQLHHVAGRRRHQAGHRASARPTTSATTSARTRSPSTT